jgi:hypothetical protein
MRKSKEAGVARKAKVALKAVKLAAVAAVTLITVGTVPFAPDARADVPGCKAAHLVVWATLAKPALKRGERFTATVRLVNNGDDCTIPESRCGPSQDWALSTDAIMLATPPCFSDALTTKVIKKNENYRRDLKLLVVPTAAPGPLNFEFIYKPEPKNAPAFTVRSPKQVLEILQ